jgi:STE24 endopeptidase
MQLVVILILSLVLALPRPLLPLLDDAGWVMLAAAAATLLPAAGAWAANRRILRLLEADPRDPRPAQQAFGRSAHLMALLVGACHSTLLMFTSWGLMARATPVIGDWVAVAGLLSIVPFLLSVLLVWIALYPSDRAVRQIALETYLFQGRPVRPVWSMREYLVFNFRHQVLFILLPMALILAARDVIELCEPHIPVLARFRFMSDVLLGLAAVGVAIVTPAILRHVWVTQRLPNGPLRDRLLRLCGRLKMRCREILVWRSGGMVVNAAVMGVLPPLRYVLITDGMLEQMDDAKIEAVFGHEAGHVKRHHILFFLLFASISGCLVTALSAHGRRLDAVGEALLVASIGLLLVIKWGFVFGWVSRRFERQADVFGVRTLAVSGIPCGIPCALHESAAGAAIDPRSSAELCSTAAHLFGLTLNEVAHLNGIPPEARSFRHSSISSRSRFVQTLAQDPEATRRFERDVRRIQLWIALAAVACGAWAAYELRLWRVAEFLAMA